MTTAAWSSGNASSTDAEFRAWGSEFAAKLAAVGMVQTADTGQINWTTVTNPVVKETDAGYEIWRFNDAMQATAPIFIKFYYGQGSQNGALGANPRIRVELGTGSNGTGTLTGTGSGTVRAGNHAVTTTGSSGSATATPSYMCHTSGFFGYVWHAGNKGEGYFALSRTCDTSGVPDATGAVMWSYGASTPNLGNLANAAFLRYASPASVVMSVGPNSGAAVYLSYAPGTAAFTTSTTLPSGDKQAFLCWGLFPDMRPVNGICNVQSTEFAAQSTFSVAMVGSTAHTYLQMGIVGAGFQIGLSSGNLAMLWE